MTVVVDSGILIALGLPDEPLHNQARTLVSTWQQQSELMVAPTLLRSEITAVLRKVVYQRRITHDEGRMLLMRLLQQPIEFVDDDRLLIAAYDLAARYNRPRTYDTQYLALAERYNCEFWTADETLVNAIQLHFNRIRWLGSFSP